MHKPIIVIGENFQFDEVLGTYKEAKGNPNSKWNFSQLGGRFTRRLVARKNKERIVGMSHLPKNVRSVFETPVFQYVDGVRIEDLVSHGVPGPLICVSERDGWNEEVPHLQAYLRTFPKDYTLAVYDCQCLPEGWTGEIPA